LARRMASVMGDSIELRVAPCPDTEVALTPTPLPKGEGFQLPSPAGRRAEDEGGVW